MSIATCGHLPPLGCSACGISMLTVWSMSRTEKDGDEDDFDESDVALCDFLRSFFRALARLFWNQIFTCLFIIRARVTRELFIRQYQINYN